MEGAIQSLSSSSLLPDNLPWLEATGTRLQVM